MSEERDGIIVLVDENGEESEFEHIDTIEMNGDEYVILLPVDEYSEEDDGIDELDEIDEEEGEVIILKIEHGEDGEDSLVSIEDEDELDAVFEEFKNRMEEYDFDEE
jgi:uncharacterized protein YrzB (UPF0473 family)